MAVHWVPGHFDPAHWHEGHWVEVPAPTGHWHRRHFAGAHWHDTHWLGREPELAVVEPEPEAPPRWVFVRPFRSRDAEGWSRVIPHVGPPTRGRRR